MIGRPRSTGTFNNRSRIFKKVPVTLKNMLENIVMGIKFDPREVILHHEEGVDVIPSNKLLSGLDVSLIIKNKKKRGENYEI